jgi:hypothetical protein
MQFAPTVPATTKDRLLATTKATAHRDVVPLAVGFQKVFLAALGTNWANYTVHFN